MRVILTRFWVQAQELSANKSNAKFSLLRKPYSALTPVKAQRRQFKKRYLAASGLFGLCRSQFFDWKRTFDWSQPPKHWKSKQRNHAQQNPTFIQRAR